MRDSACRERRSSARAAFCAITGELWTILAQHRPKYNCTGPHSVFIVRHIGCFTFVCLHMVCQWPPPVSSGGTTKSPSGLPKLSLFCATTKTLSFVTSMIAKQPTTSPPKRTSLTMKAAASTAPRARSTSRRACHCCVAFFQLTAAEPFARDGRIHHKSTYAQAWALIILGGAAHVPPMQQVTTTPNLKKRVPSPMLHTQSVRLRARLGEHVHVREVVGKTYPNGEPAWGIQVVLAPAAAIADVRAGDSQ